MQNTASIVKCIYEDEGGGKGEEGGWFRGGRYEKAAGCEVNGTDEEGGGRVRASIGSMQRPEQLWKEVSPFSHDPAMGQNSGPSLPGSSHFANIYTGLVYADNAYTTHLCTQTDPHSCVHTATFRLGRRGGQREKTLTLISVTLGPLSSSRPTVLDSAN